MTTFGMVIIILGMISTVFILAYSIAMRSQTGSSQGMWIYKGWPFVVISALCFAGLLVLMVLLFEYDRVKRPPDQYVPVTEQLYKIKK